MYNDITYYIVLNIASTVIRKIFKKRNSFDVLGLFYHRESILYPIVPTPATPDTFYNFLFAS